MKKILLLLAVLATNIITAQEKIAVPYRAGNLYGLSDMLGNIMVKPKYSLVKQFCYYFDKGSTSRFLVKDKKSWKVINGAGRVMVDGKLYDSLKIEEQDAHITYMYKNNAIGISFNDKVIATPQYSEVKYTVTGYMVVGKDKKYGLLNNAGKLAIPVTNDNVYRSWETDYDDPQNVWTVVNDWQESEVKTPQIYYEMPDMEMWDFAEVPDAPKPNFNEGDFTDYKSIRFTACFLVEKDKLWGVYDNGLHKVILPLAYKSLSDIEVKDGHVVLFAQKDDRYGIINEMGTVIVPLDNSYMRYDYDWNVVYYGKNNLNGAYVINSGGFIKTLYESIKAQKQIPLYNFKTFQVFIAKRNGIEFLVGENGVEYYKP